MEIVFQQVPSSLSMEAMTTSIMIALFACFVATTLFLIEFSILNKQKRAACVDLVDTCNRFESESEGKPAKHIIPLFVLQIVCLIVAAISIVVGCASLGKLGSETADIPSRTEIIQQAFEDGYSIELDHDEANAISKSILNGNTSYFLRNDGDYNRKIIVLWQEIPSDNAQEQDESPVANTIKVELYMLDGLNIERIAPASENTSNVEAADANDKK